MTQSSRYTVLDILRGFALVNMILYHAMWDIVYMFKVNIVWFRSDGAHIWQQCICWTFILLSGFCWSMGKRRLKRALITLGGSLIITLVTAVCMPNNIILFGILSLLGTAMLVLIPLDKLFVKINPYVGAVLSFLLFCVTRYINSGTLRLGDFVIAKLPETLYANYFTAYLGLPHSSFYSSDYFSVLPWIFLFFTGYFLYHVFKKHNLLKYLSAFRLKPLEFLGRHSLIFYMIHQPVVYAVLFVVFNL